MFISALNRTFDSVLVYLSVVILEWSNFKVDRAGVQFDRRARFSLECRLFTHSVRDVNCARVVLPEMLHYK
jgi:hypothetical protein